VKLFFQGAQQLDAVQGGEVQLLFEVIAGF